MSLTTFQKEDFDVFKIEGLDERMEAIQTRIQPKFKQVGDILTTDLSMLLGNEMHLHIAKHARRKVNPPNDTWLAICHNKRGYKKHPHFQLGLFDDHLFIWLAFIYELPNKTSIARSFIKEQDSLFSQLSHSYLLSMDHMKKDAEQITSLNEDELHERLVRFRDVKKAEFLIGRHLLPNDPILQDEHALVAFTKETYEQLLPIYKKAMTQCE